MTAEDTQNLLVATLSKIAEKKKVEDKKEVMKSKDKKMDSKCDYAEKVAETLDYLHSNFDLTFGSSIQKAIKLASDNPVPNMVHHEASSGPAGRPINETRDSMAVGEEPSSNSKGLGTVAGVPNIVAGTLDKRPGGAPVDPSNPPLMNKSAYSKVLAKLAQNKTAGIEVPNQVRLMDATESGKGQSGYDSGSSHGNGNRSLVNTSNERAMSYTKADAKKSYIKEQVGQVFDEVHPEKDNALDRAFSHGVETAKMAGMSNAARGALGGAGVGLAVVGAQHLMNKHPNGLIPEMLNKSASVTGNMGAGGLIGGGLREGVSSLGGKALGGLAGLATKGTELASDVGQGVRGVADYVKQNPKRVGQVGLMTAGLMGAGAGAQHLGDTIANSAMGEDPSTGRIIGAGVGGAALPLGLLAKGHPGLAAASILPGAYGGAALGDYMQKKMAPTHQKEAMGIESFNHESSLADTIDSMKDRTKVKQAGLADAKKLEAMAKKEVKEEKAEEKLVPGIHEKIEKEASLVTKGAMLLRKLAEAVPTNMPPQAAAELPAQGGVPPEDAQEMGGQEDQIEKLKKLLLLMQMAKKQEEQQVMQGQSAMPDVASPGGASANEMAAATSGPAQGIM